MRATHLLTNALASLCTVWSACAIASPIPGHEDIMDVVGFFFNQEGGKAVENRAQQEAVQQAQKFLKDKPPGFGVIIHQITYSVTSHPDSALRPVDVTVVTGGAGVGKVEALANDAKPRLEPGINGAKSRSKLIYFENKPDGSVRHEYVTRKEIERANTPPASSPVPTPAPSPPPRAPNPPEQLQRAPDFSPGDWDLKPPIPIEKWKAYEQKRNTS